jgi:ribosomal protein S18 acetylase RimI-like enzyme
MIQIKPLVFKEIACFVDVHLACFKECYQGIYNAEVFFVREKKKNQRIEHIKKRLTSKNYFYCALYDDQEIVGILIFSILDYRGLLDALYIKKDYQNLGYGTKLLQVMELQLQKLGISEYIVYVSNLIPSNRFFERRHAKKVSEEPISIHGKDYIENEYVVKVGDNI